MRLPIAGLWGVQPKGPRVWHVGVGAPQAGGLGGGCRDLNGMRMRRVRHSWGLGV